MSAEIWYYSRDGKQFGPVAFERLKELAASGELRPIEHLWKEGMPSWVPADSVADLFPGPPAGTTPPPPPRGAGKSAAGEFTQHATQAAKEASQDAFAAVKILITDPVGGLREAYETLGPTRAMQAGIAFGVVYVLCDLFGTLMLARSAETILGQLQSSFFVSGAGGISFRVFLVSLVSAFVPPLAITGGVSLVRRLFGGSGSLSADVFIAGASILPFGAGLLAAGLLSLGVSFDSHLILIFAGSFTVLMLFSGCARILNIPEAKSTLAVSITLVLTAIALNLLRRLLWRILG